MEDNIIVCRCSDLTIKDIRKLISKGYTTFDEIKRLSRAGMGPCQGRNCAQLILRELSSATGKSLEELLPGSYRPPVKAIKLGEIADYFIGGDSHE